MNDKAAAELSKALGHPIRLAFLRALRETDELSPTNFAVDSGEPLGNVSYHVNKLAEAGVIKIVDRVARRGAMEHRYALGGKRSAAALGVIDFLSQA